MKVTIEIPDNCELVKDGEKYIVKEKKQVPPRTWEEFCKKSSGSRAFIDYNSNIVRVEQSHADPLGDRNLCASVEEAEAFLALMQLRQLRKAWVGDWEPDKDSGYWAVYKHITMGVIAESPSIWEPTLTFPTKNMAKDFLMCFRTLCEIAKELL